MSNDEFPVEVETAQVSDENKILTPTDIGWQDYVFKQMHETEFTDGCPNVDGLRRMALKLLGQYDVSIKVIQAPNPHNDNHGTVRCRLDFADRSVEAVADSYQGNTKKYANYSLAIADTRAEVRALRRALNIKKVSAEELDSHDESKQGFQASADKINDAQIGGIDLQCKRANINIKKLVELVLQARYNTVNELTHDSATLVVNKVGELLRTGIPADLLGYEADWKATFGN